MRLHRVLVACTLACLAARARAATCVVDGAVGYQTIDGFGFSSAWSGRIGAPLGDTLFGTSSGQLGFTILRIRIDPNKYWADEISNAAVAHAHGATVFGTPWTPPVEMKTNGATNHGKLLPEKYAAYAAYLREAASTIGLDIVSLQNEPDWDPDYEGCTWTADDFHTFIRDAAQDIGKPILFPESLGFYDTMSDPTLNDPVTAAKVSIVGGHFYGSGNSVHQNAIDKGKRVWETEHYVNGTDNIAACMSVADEVSDAMNNRFNAYLWWWLNPSDANAGLVSGATPHKNAYTLGQFARFVRPGMTRVAASWTPSAKVRITAYRSADTLVVVAVNSNPTPVEQPFTLQNLDVAALSAVRTSATENMAALPDLAVAGGGFTATLPAQSITTFKGSLAASTPTYALTVSRAGTGAGTVASTPSGIACGATCSATYTSGTTVLLTATPATGSVFAGWSGACAGTGTCQVTMGAARAVTATFEVSGDGGGGGGRASGGGVHAGCATGPGETLFGLLALLALRRRRAVR